MIEVSQNKFNEWVKDRDEWEKEKDMHIFQSVYECLIMVSRGVICVCSSSECDFSEDSEIVAELLEMFKANLIKKKVDFQ